MAVGRLSARLAALKEGGAASAAAVRGPLPDAAALEASALQRLASYSGHDLAKAGCPPASELVRHERHQVPRGGPLKAIVVVRVGAMCDALAPGGYEAIHLGFETEAGVIPFGPVHENENSGCCGAYRELELKLEAFPERTPPAGDEVMFAASFTDQDSDMGDDAIYHESSDAEWICGLDAGGAPFCRVLERRRLSYSGSLERFLGGDEPLGEVCTALELDGAGIVTRTTVGCQDRAPKAPPTQARIMDAPAPPL